MIPKRLISIFALFLNGCDLYPAKTLDAKLTSTLPRTILATCSEVGKVFEADINSASSQKDSVCDAPLGRQFDFVCAYSHFLDENNDWELERETLEQRLLNYKSVPQEKYYSLDFKKGASQSTYIIGLSKETNIWLEMQNLSPYEDMPIIVETLGKNEVEHSFLNRVTCIDMRKLSGDLSLRLKIPTH